MHLLEDVATPTQKERYLRPLVAGEVRSCFAMTEPPPGAGSDPSALPRRAPRATAAAGVIDGAQVVHHRRRRRGASSSAWRARGRRTPRRDDVPRRRGQPGLRRRRAHRHPRRAAVPAGTARSRSSDCRRADGRRARRGRPRASATRRCGSRPARLTHCMRWLGVARRAHEIAVDRARRAASCSARRLAELGMVQAPARRQRDRPRGRPAMIWHAACACWTAAGAAARSPRSPRRSSSEAVSRVVDRSVQICGGQGVSARPPLARFLATCARSASTTAPPRCIAGRWLAALSGGTRPPDAAGRAALSS